MADVTNLRCRVSYQARVRRPRKQTFDLVRYTSEIVVAVLSVDPADAPVVFSGDPLARPRGPDVHRWHDGRLWGPVRDGAGEPPVTAVVALQKLSGCDLRHAPVEGDATVREVGWTDRAEAEAAARAAAADTLLVDGTCWHPVDEPVLVVDNPDFEPTVGVRAKADADLDRCTFRIDQGDWVAALHPGARVPAVDAPRPDLLGKRTTDRAVASVARSILDGMVPMLAEAGPDLFAAYHRLRTLARPYAAALDAGSAVDWEPLAAALDAAVAHMAHPDEGYESYEACIHGSLAARLDLARQAAEDDLALCRFAP